MTIGEIEVKTKPPFDILYDDKRLKGINFIVCMGGRGGKKTYELSKWIAVSATIKKKRCVILRDEKSIIKESILSEIWDRYETANIDGVLDEYFIKNETELKERETGKVLIYTKGFRASSNQKKTNLKGSSNIDIALIEEGEDVRDKDKFYTFIDSLRKHGCIVVFIMNTPDIHHFIIKEYYNLEQVADGYYKVHPRNIKGFLGIFTTYQDNEYLPSHIVERYEGYKEKDLHYYYTSILGYASTGRKGQILTKVKPISLADYMALPFKEYYGQDFGTASPAGLVGVKFDRNTCYARQINYLPMSALSIGKLYCELNFGVSDRIVADNADKEAIKKLSNGFERKDLTEELINKYPKLLKGFYIVPCKNKDISFRISLMDSLNLFAVEESKDLWNEIVNWCYAQDKNGNYTDEPMAGFDHLLDGWGYCIIDHYAQSKQGSGMIAEFGK
jgi:PBSX family phage terminase large subunit